MREISNIIIEVCGHYGIPVIDVNGKSGYSFVNSTTYTSDGVHPNELGAKKLAETIIRELKCYEPINL